MSSEQLQHQLPDEGRPLAHLLELACTDVGAGRADSSEHIEHGHGDVPAVGHLHALTLTRPGTQDWASSGLDDIFKTSIFPSPTICWYNLYSATPPACFSMAMAEDIP